MENRRRMPSLCTDASGVLPGQGWRHKYGRAVQPSGEGGELDGQYCDGKCQVTEGSEAPRPTVTVGSDTWQSREAS